MELWHGVVNKFRSIFLRVDAGWQIGPRCRSSAHRCHLCRRSSILSSGRRFRCFAIPQQTHQLERKTARTSRIPDLPIPSEGWKTVSLSTLGIADDPKPTYTFQWLSVDFVAYVCSNQIYRGSANTFSRHLIELKISSELLAHDFSHQVLLLLCWPLSVLQRVFPNRFSAAVILEYPGSSRPTNRDIAL